jgi:hypothetical protein
LAGEVLAEELCRVRGAADERAAPVDHEYRSARAARHGPRELGDPFHPDRRQDDAAERAVLMGDGERGHESGRVLHAVDQVVAEHELVRPKGLLKIGPVGYVEPDRARIGRAGEAAVGSGNAKPANRGNVCSQLGERTVAVRRIERHPLMSTSEDAEEGARGIDDLALRRFAAARQID